MMRFVLTWMLCLSGPGLAGSQQADLFGRWGSALQCSGGLIQPGGSQRAAAFEISQGWLRHGNSWCALTWVTQAPRAAGFFASTQALCGEDSQRRYRLDFVLNNAELTLIWDEGLLNGPLTRCTTEPTNAD